MHLLRRFLACAGVMLVSPILAASASAAASPYLNYSGESLIARNEVISFTSDDGLSIWDMSSKAHSDTSFTCSSPNDNIDVVAAGVGADGSIYTMAELGNAAWGSPGLTGPAPDANMAICDAADVYYGDTNHSGSLTGLDNDNGSPLFVLMRSADDGHTWTWYPGPPENPADPHYPLNLNDPFRPAVALTPGAGGVIFGDPFSAWRFDLASQTWSEQPAGDTLGLLWGTNRAISAADANDYPAEPTYEPGVQPGRRWTIERDRVLSDGSVFTDWSSSDAWRDGARLITRTRDGRLLSSVVADPAFTLPSTTPGEPGGPSCTLPETGVAHGFGGDGIVASDNGRVLWGTSFDHSSKFRCGGQTHESLLLPTLVVSRDAGRHWTAVRMPGIDPEVLAVDGSAPVISLARPDGKSGCANSDDSDYWRLDSPGRWVNLGCRYTAESESGT